ncbi:MAG TPA: GNAT family N-acetyltransferase [Polyangium sp.]|nr:GNAT family N-acetyltransferase [Polyangium sp.]
MPNVEVALAALADEVALQNMMQLYIYDFTEQWVGLSDQELGRNAAFADLNAEGRFRDFPLDAYWMEEGRVPLLIKADGRLAGFALLNKYAHSGLGLDRNMAEFFVVRRYRRTGVGTKAAHAIFTAYPGQWELAIARRNAGALAFWRNAITTHPGVNELEENDVNNEAWDGAILRFQIRSLPE